METFPLKWGLYGDSSLWRLFLFIPLYGDSSLWRLFLFTGTLRGLFSMETFPLYSSLRGLYEDFTGTLLYGDFSSLRGLYGDSSLWRLFLFTLLYGDSSLWRLFLFTGTLRGLFSMETFPLYCSLRGLFSMETFPLCGDFIGTLRGLSNFRSISRRLWIPGVLDAKFLCSGNILLLQTDFITLFLRTAAFRLRG